MGGDTQFEVLLDLRENERDRARTELSDELGELDRLRTFANQKREDVREVELELERVEKQRDEMLDSEGFQPRDVSSLQQHVKTLRGRLERRREALQRALDAVEEQNHRCQDAREALRDAQTALKAVRKHYQRLEEQKQLEEKRDAASANDEVALRRWWEQNN